MTTNKTPENREELVELRARAMFSSVYGIAHTGGWSIADGCDVYADEATRETYRKMARATLEAEEAAGLAVVPVEPTYGCYDGSMSWAGAEVLPSVDGVFGTAGRLACGVYKAMLSASPYRKEG